MMWILGVAHTLRQHHIDHLIEILVEKGFVNIKLAKAPLAMECKAKHGMDSDGIYHGIESLMKINTQRLVKAFSNKSSFLPSNRAIRILFNAKNSFVAHYVLPLARGNERPSVVSYESIMLILHDMYPLRILESLGDSIGFEDRWKYSGETISRVGFEDGTFRSGLH